MLEVPDSQAGTHVNESLFRQSAIAHHGAQMQGELLLSQPLNVQVLGAVITLVTLVSLLLLGLGEYGRKVAVPGELVPGEGLITLAAPASARVAQILVMPGDRVEPGQAVLRLSYASGGDGQHNDTRLMQALADQQQAVSAQWQNEYARHQTLDRHFAGKGRQLAEQQTQLTRMLEYAGALVTLKENAITRARLLYARGNLTVADLEAVQSAWLEQQNRVHELQLQSVRLQAEREALDTDKAAALLDARQAMARLDAREAELRQMQVRMEQEQGLVMTAPVSGYISDTAATVGASVGAGAQLLTIVPRESGLRAEFKVSGAAIGFLQPGQKVHLRLDAFAYQKFGVLEAVVQDIAGSTRVASAGMFTTPESTYRVTATLDRQTITAYGQEQALLAGMGLEADITLDHRNLLEWLLEPLFSITGRQS